MVINSKFKHNNFSKVNGYIFLFFTLGIFQKIYISYFIIFFWNPMMIKYFFYLQVVGVLFLCSAAQAAQVQEPASLQTFREGRRFLTPQETAAFVYHNQMPTGLDLAGLNVGHVYAMAWSTIGNALVHAVANLRDNVYQNINNINEVIDIDGCYRQLRMKDRHCDRVANLSQIERNIVIAMGAITTTLESRVRNSFFRLVSSSDEENRRQAFNCIFDIHLRSRRLLPGLLPVEGSYFQVVISGLRSTEPDTFRRNPLPILIIEEEFAFLDLSHVTDPACLLAARQVRMKLLDKCRDSYAIHEKSFLENCRNGAQRSRAASDMVECVRKIEWLNVAIGHPVQGQFLTNRNRALFYQRLAESNLLTPLEISSMGHSADLAGRVLSSVRIFNNELAERIARGTATKHDLELAIEYCQSVALAIKSEAFLQQDKVNSLRPLAIEINGAALERIASGDRKILRKLDAVRLCWGQQVLNWDGQIALYPQAYTVLEAVKDRALVRSQTIPLVLAAFIVKRNILPDGCTSHDDAALIAAELYKNYEKHYRREVPAAKRARIPDALFTPTQSSCPYRTAADSRLRDLAAALEERLASLIGEDPFDDGEEVLPVADVVHVALAAAVDEVDAVDVACAQEDGERGLYERRLGRKRAASLLDDNGQDDLVEPAELAAASAAVPSPVSARSRVGTGVGVHHVAPLDEKRKQAIRELHGQFKRTSPTRYMAALLEHINNGDSIQKYGFPDRSDPVTKDQIYHLMGRHKARSAA